MSSIDGVPSGTLPCTWCVRPTDVGSDAALFVQLRRGVDEELETWSRFLDLPFCSEDHARQWFASRPVPAESEWASTVDDEDESLGEMVGCAIGVLLALCLVAGGGYGFWLLVERIAAALGA